MHNRLIHRSLGRSKASSSGTSNLVVAFVLLLSASCATLVPPIQQTSDTEREPIALTVSSVSNRGPQIRVRVDPQVVGTLLEIYRAEGDSEFELLDEVVITTALEKALRGKGLVYRDRAPFEQSVIYQVAVVGGTSAFASNREVVPNLPGPSAPELVGISTPEGILLQWSQPADQTALFRRDVLHPDRPIVRIDVQGGAHYLDRDIELGGVYAYRVANAVVHDGWPRFGDVTAELFVAGLDEDRGKDKVEQNR